MSSPFVAEIRIFPFSFAPKGWAFCNGQLLPLSQNTALFSLLGTSYGGNGTSNFALPNLQGSIAIGAGQGAGLSDYAVGESGGSATTTLIATNLPPHRHNAMAVAAAGNQTSPANRAIAQGSSRSALMYKPAPQTTGAMQQLSPEGGNLPHDNMMPYLTLSFCIALQGIFPPRG